MQFYRDQKSSLATVFLCCMYRHVHIFISNFFIYRFFLKKKKSFPCGTKIFPIILTQQQRKEQGVEASSAEWGPLLGGPKGHQCIHFLGGQRMPMESFLQWEPKAQHEEGQRNQENEVSHFPKGVERLHSSIVTTFWTSDVSKSPALTS